MFIIAEEYNKVKIKIYCTDLESEQKEKEGS